MFRQRCVIFLAVLLLVVNSAAQAQTPPWILLEQGKAAYEQRRLSEALIILLETVEIRSDYPEAEYWLGRVYQAQGHLDLAEEQYRRALDLALYLRVPDDAVVYRYSLASLLMDQGPQRRFDAEVILVDLANREGASDPGTVLLEHQYIRVLAESGLDEMLFLYRSELGASLKARRMLGEAAWNDGRYRSSLLHSTRTVLSVFSTAANLYRTDYNGWRFDIDPAEDALQPDRDVRFPGKSDGAQDFLERLQTERPRLWRWMGAEGFWPQLYLLGCSLYAEGYLESARSVWALFLVDEEPRPESGQWGFLARRQLDEPFLTIGSLAP